MRRTLYDVLKKQVREGAASHERSFIKGVLLKEFYKEDLVYKQRCGCVLLYNIIVQRYAVEYKILSDLHHGDKWRARGS